MGCCQATTTITTASTAQDTLETDQAVTSDGGCCGGDATGNDSCCAPSATV
ncbi:hypothetical protein Celgi_2812 [Cellulomonas gilvus ATCC 13127]|uniref:Uncharacterized protein n=1 Tax=Cellulomonas gilvus (strain ATCC 13127 / NRRL B-14078) TaxID=593907 RepID=F8A563_CELGA|nr:hypothetical protein Celgi_2812 [Cellulomonas gilvus ATCC 13127]